ncbi:MAG TPA: hypothetical protein VF623_03840 [Segetibacter sp.]|jgi:hypothetical protein
MRLQIAIVLFLFAFCRNKHGTGHVEFNRIMPDTSKTWAGRMTQEAFNQTRTFGKTLNLGQLIEGTPQEEIRVWYLSGSYDPQVVFIAKADSFNKWSLRTISFYRTKSDSIYADYSRVLRQSAVDSLNLHKYWQLTSQSDLPKGDTYGCLDGEDIFIEMSNRIKYKSMWYRCPEINKNKDTTFHSAASLVNRLDALAVEH